MKHFLIFLLVIVMSSLACGEPGLPAPECETLTPVQVDATERSYRMGFTRWPPEATLEGIQRMDRFIEKHADLTALQFDGGVPWPEALVNKDFSAGLLADWTSTRTDIPADHALLISITPLNLTRTELVLYWGESDNMPLPDPWNSYQLDHPDVRAAYFNYARKVIEFFDPDYFAIGIEVNVAQVNAPNTWIAYKELHKFHYPALKDEYPGLPIFATYTLSHMNGLDGGDRDSQRKEIAEILEYSDLIGLSVYPYGWFYPSGKADPIPDDLFDIALDFDKPIAVTESGAPSQDFKVFGKQYRFSEEYQRKWIDFLLHTAGENRFEFVVNWASLDFDKLLEIMPDKETKDLATIWVYTGMERSNGCQKSALAVWDSHLQILYSSKGGNNE